MAYNKHHSNSNKFRKCGDYIAYYNTDTDNLPRVKRGIDWDSCSGYVVEHEQFGPITIGERFGDNLEITFNRTGNTITTHYANLLRGNITDYEQPTLLGVGVRGAKTKVNSKTSREYILWNNVLRRCYDEKSKDYPRYGGKGIKPCGRWLRFDNFSEDIKKLEGYDEWIKNPNYQLDKDKKAIAGQVKCYSPETCCFISLEENTQIRWNKWQQNTIQYNVLVI